MKPLRRFNTWRGSYKGIYYKITDWKTDYNPNGYWCYYVYFSPSDPIRIFNKLWKNSRANYGMYNCPIIENLKWHCGCTYLERAVSNGNKYIKAGCDYQHYWDEGIEYCVESIQSDAIATIDDFLSTQDSISPLPTPLPIALPTLPVK